MSEKKRRRLDYKATLAIIFALLLCVALGACAVLGGKNRVLAMQLSMERQRDMSDVVSAMADIEVNLHKLLIASGAAQSVDLLGETALLAQHVETGLARLPLSAEASSGAMKFAGQMGDYALTLATQVSSGSAITASDEKQIEGMLTACQGLNAHLLDVGERLYTEPMGEANLYTGNAQGWPNEAIAGDSDIAYPSLIYDGPFSDGRTDGAPKGLTGERITREQARQAAARYAGVDASQVQDAADSGGPFEAFGFSADTPDGRVSVQVTGAGGHLLWMMPESAEFEERIEQEACLQSAQDWLLRVGFGPMERCFVQRYDGMIVANFASVQDGVLLYPDQVKVQVSMATGAVVGAECSQYLMNHAERADIEPAITIEEAQQMLSNRLRVSGARLCVIPTDEGETLCWEFAGEFGGEAYLAYVDAKTGEAAQILRVERSEKGEMAL